MHKKIRKHFSREQVVELTFFIACMNCLNRFNNALLRVRGRLSGITRRRFFGPEKYFPKNKKKLFTNRPAPVIFLMLLFVIKNFCNLE